MASDISTILPRALAFIVLLAGLLTIGTCAYTFELPDPVPHERVDLAEDERCPTDTFECPDGTRVDRDPAQQCAFDCAGHEASIEPGGNETTDGTGTVDGAVDDDRAPSGSGGGGSGSGGSSGGGASGGSGPGGPAPDTDDPATGTDPLVVEIIIGEEDVENVAFDEGSQIDVTAMILEGTAITYEWSAVPDGLAIDHPTQAETIVSSSTAGSYTLSVTVSDGTSTANDTIDVTVAEVAEPSAPTGSLSFSNWPHSNPHGSDPRILFKFWRNTPLSITDPDKQYTLPDGMENVQREVAYMRYAPNGFIADLEINTRVGQSDPYDGRSYTIADAGAFENWDVLLTDPDAYRNDRDNKAHSITLSRQATVGIVWRGSPDDIPLWLDDWTYAGDVVINSGWTGGPVTRPVYTKVLAEGYHFLGGKEDTSPFRTYVVIFAEADGLPSVYPEAPDGREQPAPNAYCPEWVHDEYVLEAHDGQDYPTWHPQVDPVYWCYFGHEHGSMPLGFEDTVTALNGYVTARLGQPEAHNGFKYHTFKDKEENLWLMKVHMGTSGLRRICARFHTWGYALKNAQTGELLADLNVKVDFGTPRYANDSDNTLHDLYPDLDMLTVDGKDCRTEMARLHASGETTGHVNVNSGRWISYESWQPDFATTDLGIIGQVTPVNDNPLTYCVDENCTELASTGVRGGERRWFVIQGSSGEIGFDATASVGEGQFYTEPYGNALRTGSDPDAVYQYLKPGLDYRGHEPFDNGKFVIDEPFVRDYLFLPDVIRPSSNIEDSLRSPN